MVEPEYYYGYEVPPSMDLPPNQPVNIEVDTVYGLGLTMARENENFRPRAKAISQQFQVDENGVRSADYPIATGLASISPGIRSALDYQDLAMSTASNLLRDHVAGNEALANISMKIATEFNSTDELNAADIDTVRDVTGIEPPPPPPPYRGGGPQPI